MQGVNHHHPYGKENHLSKERIAYLLDPSTKCLFCSKADPVKTIHENIGQVDWRSPLTDEETFPLCRLCMKVRRGRTLKQVCLYANKILVNFPRRRDPMSGLVAFVSEHGKEVSIPDSAKARAKYKSYVSRQAFNPLTKCSFGSLGENRDQQTSSNDRLSYPQFRWLLGMPCFYCQSERGGTLDRIDPLKCYSFGNVAPACAECNKMKSNLGIDEFIQHLRRLCQG